MKIDAKIFPEKLKKHSWTIDIFYHSWNPMRKTTGNGLRTVEAWNQAD